MSQEAQSDQDPVCLQLDEGEKLRESTTGANSRTKFTKSSNLSFDWRCDSRDDLVRRSTQWECQNWKNRIPFVRLPPQNIVLPFSATIFSTSRDLAGRM